MHIDKYGIIGQIQPDSSIEGGDSACWHGHYVYLTSDNEVDYVDTFEIAPGAYVRHPDPEQTFYGFGAYYASPYDGVMSRDQLTGVAAALARVDQAAARRLLKHHSLRLFLTAYNTRKNGADPKDTPWKMPDILGPDMLAMFLRAARLGVAVRPLLWLGDLHLLINTLVDRLFKPKSDDVINHLGRLFVAQEFQPTLIGKLAALLADRAYYKRKLIKYWCGWRDLPRMAQLFIDRLDKL